MDLLCKRFPLASKMILRNLDSQSLIRSKEASKEMSKCLDNQKFYWIQLIKKFSKKFQGHEKSWKEALYKTPVDITKQLAIAVQEFFQKYRHEKLAPLHFAVERDNFQLCEYIISKTKEKNPKGKLGLIRYQILNEEITRWKIKGVIF